MNDINSRINELVSSFVGEITRLARAAAVDTLSRALTDGGVAEAPAKPRRGRPPGSGNSQNNTTTTASYSAPAMSRAPAAQSAAADRGKGAKRPKAEIAQMQERVLAHISANPGQRIEQINKVLGTKTSDLTLPLKKLLADGTLSTKGARRATTYSLASSGGGDAGKKRRGRGK